LLINIIWISIGQFFEYFQFSMISVFWKKIRIEKPLVLVTISKNQRINDFHERIDPKN
jgi:hypothetical protein